MRQDFATNSDPRGIKGKLITNRSCIFRQLCVNVRFFLCLFSGIGAVPCRCHARREPAATSRKKTHSSSEWNHAPVTRRNHPLFFVVVVVVAAIRQHRHWLQQHGAVYRTTPTSQIRERLEWNVILLHARSVRSRVTFTTFTGLYEGNRSDPMYIMRIYALLWHQVTRLRDCVWFMVFTRAVTRENTHTHTQKNEHVIILFLFGHLDVCMKSVKFYTEL